MNPTVANIVEQARMGYLALRTGDYRDLRRAVDPVRDHGPACRA